MRRGVVLAAAVFVAAGALAGQEPAPAVAPALRVRHTITTPFPLGAWTLARLGDGPASALVLVGARGEVRTAVLRDEPAAAFAGALELPDPGRCLLAVGRLDGNDRPPALVVAGPAGIGTCALGEDRAFAGPVRPLLRRPRMTLRTGRPVFAGMVEDLNADGRGDLILPDGENLELWVSAAAAAAPGGGAADPGGLRLAASFPVDVDRRQATEARLLSDALECWFTIPRLRMQDVNGDGRTDVVVGGGRSFAWHVQRQDGAIPAEPDVRVDLTLFRDTTPEASVRPGRTLAGGDRPRLVSRDLDGDGSLDAVIAHRRKVWVFPGTPAGPQFKEPSAILKSADDVTVLLLVNLDDDGRPDLLILRIQVPTVAALVMGMLGSWDVELAAIGYANVDGRTFARTPGWKRELTFTLPSIASILRDPDALLRRFEDAGRKFRAEAEGDLDGDGRTDVVLATEEDDAVEWWMGRAASGSGEPADVFDRLVRRLLFEDPDPVWTLDRVIGLFGHLASERVARITGGRPADGRTPLRARASARLTALAAADVRGDAAAEVLAVYADPATGLLSGIDVLGRD